MRARGPALLDDGGHIQGIRWCCLRVTITQGGCHHLLWTGQGSREPQIHRIPANLSLAQQPGSPQGSDRSGHETLHLANLQRWSALIAVTDVPASLPSLIKGEKQEVLAPSTKSCDWHKQGVIKINNNTSKQTKARKNTM